MITGVFVAFDRRHFSSLVLLMLMAAQLCDVTVWENLHRCFYFFLLYSRRSYLPTNSDHKNNIDENGFNFSIGHIFCRCNSLIYHFFKYFGVLLHKLCWEAKGTFVFMPGVNDWSSKPDKIHVSESSYSKQVAPHI